jgi:Periplasmic binding protein
MLRVRSVVAVLLAAALVCAGCSKKSSTSTGSGSGSSSSSAAPLTASFRGVTATTIKIGIVRVKFTDCILQFTQSTQGDAQKIEKALVDDFNQNGGIDGRQVEVVFKELCPLHPDEVAAACTELTDDDQVFAVLGDYDTEPGDGTNQLCVAKDHQTVLIDDLSFQKALDEAPPGMLIRPSIAPKRGLEAVLGLLKQANTLKGKKVAVLTDQTRADVSTKLVADNAATLGYTTGSNAVLSISGADTTQAQTQLDSFIEKWKTESVDTLIITSLSAADRQFVDKIKKAIPSMQLITDDSSAANNGQTENKPDTKTTPNSYEGLLAAQGLSDEEQFETPEVQRCIGVYEKATGDKVIAPKDLKPDAQGNLIKVYEGVQALCRDLTIFKQVAEKAGPNLTNDTWVQAVNSFGEILVLGNKFASLKQGKYDAADGFRLAAFDSSIQPFGDYKPLGDLVDVTK